MNKKVLLLFLRYFALLIIAVFIDLLYNIISLITIFPSYFFLDLFYETELLGRTIFVSGTPISLGDSCLAGSAFFLLLILNLSTPMKLSKRMFSLAFSIILLLFMNILRISFFTVLFIKNSPYFDFLHMFFWYFLSIFLVLFIWFLTAYIFNIKNIPVYSDILYIVKQKNK